MSVEALFFANNDSRSSDWALRGCSPIGDCESETAVRLSASVPLRKRVYKVTAQVPSLGRVVTARVVYHSRTENVAGPSPSSLVVAQALAYPSWCRARLTTT